MSKIPLFNNLATSFTVKYFLNIALFWWSKRISIYLEKCRAFKNIFKIWESAWIEKYFFHLTCLWKLIFWELLKFCSEKKFSKKISDIIFSFFLDEKICSNSQKKHNFLNLTFKTLFILRFLSRKFRSNFSLKIFWWNCQNQLSITIFKNLLRNFFWS